MRIIVIAVLFMASLAGAQQATVTLTQCKTVTDDLRTVTSDKQFTALSQTMTAGDELMLSTRLAQCQERYATELTPKQLDVISRLGYKFDADVIGRMLSFMERHHVADAFNDEEESRKGKR